MPFQKGNKLACNQRGGTKPKTEAWNNIVGWLIGKGGERYLELMVALSNGKKITKEEKEFMDRYETLLEFHAPKLARAEVTGRDGGAITIQTINYANAQSNSAT